MRNIPIVFMRIPITDKFLFYGFVLTIIRRNRRGVPGDDAVPLGKALRHHRSRGYGYESAEDDARMNNRAHPDPAVFSDPHLVFDMLPDIQHKMIAADDAYI